MNEFPNKRDVFLFRVRSGIRPFDDLNTDTLSNLAKELKFERLARQTVRQIAKLKGLGGSTTLNPETAGELVGLSDRQVRKVMREVVKWVSNRL